MASTIRAALDRVYLVYFLIHIPVMLCVDLVPLYPISLWQPASAPLRFLGDLRAYYIATYNDQFFLPPPAEIPNFFTLFAFLELAFHLPVSLWAVSALWDGKLHSKRSGGAGELLLLVYGLQTAITTFTCMYEAAMWDPEVVSFEQKETLVGGLYGSYFALSVLLTADMYTRVLKRMNITDAAKKAQ
ncbi:transmembrane protein 6/97 [Xylaria arbuscula]|nr:transmembrane protein 6/97 [Xylaria arbuscula]